MSSSFNTLVITFRWSQARTCLVMTRAPVQVCTVTTKSSQFTTGNWQLWLWHNTMLASGKAFESQERASHDQINRKPLIRILLHHTRKSMLYKKNKKKIQSPAKRLARTFIHIFSQPSPFSFSFMRLPCMWLRLPCMLMLLRRYYDARELRIARRSLKSIFFCFRVRSVTFPEHHETRQK